MKKLLLSIIFFSWLMPLGASAVGIGVNPSFLEINFQGDKKIDEVELIVFNLSDETADIEVYIDELGDWVLIEPQEFFLEARGQRVVSLIITPQENGQRATNVSVVARPHERHGFKAGSGIKVPLRLSVSSLGEAPINFLEKGFIIGLVIIVLSLILFIIGYYYYYQRHKSLWRRILHKFYFLWHIKRRRWKL